MINNSTRIASVKFLNSLGVDMEDEKWCPTRDVIEVDAECIVYGDYGLKQLVKEDDIEYNPITTITVFHGYKKSGNTLYLYVQLKSDSKVTENIDIEVQFGSNAVLNPIIYSGSSESSLSMTTTTIGTYDDVSMIVNNPVVYRSGYSEDSYDFTTYNVGQVSGSPTTIIR